MSAIYIHIPFCKQACYYCDFHFSTNLKKKDELINALVKELQLRKNEFAEQKVKTIYFGGGTPSLLSTKEIDRLVETVFQNYTVDNIPEITLEANPDDLTEERIVQLSKSPINRLSIGVQSFFNHDLKMMNRAHDASEAEKSIALATTYFDNISIDLIYGIPGATDEQWVLNIEKALRFNIPHISSYALTIEPKTALASFIEKGIIADVDDEQAERQFQILVSKLDAAGFVNYETSNFGKLGYFSINNTAYWQGKTYMGIGPSAHSFDGKRRGWNIRNNSKYIQKIVQSELPITYEVLSNIDRYNEYVMTGLRTIWGVSFNRIKKEFGAQYLAYITEHSKRFINEGLLELTDNKLLTTSKGKFLADGIAAELFMLNLKA